VTPVETQHNFRGDEDRVKSGKSEKYQDKADGAVVSDADSADVHSLSCSQPVSGTISTDIPSKPTGQAAEFVGRCAVGRTLATALDGTPYLPLNNHCPRCNENEKAEPSASVRRFLVRKTISQLAKQHDRSLSVAVLYKGFCDLYKECVMVRDKETLREIFLEYPSIFVLFSNLEGELSVRQRPADRRIAEQLLNAPAEEARLRAEEEEVRRRLLKKEEKEKRAKQEAILRAEKEARMRTQQNEETRMKAEKEAREKAAWEAEIMFRTEEEARMRTQQNEETRMEVEKEAREKAAWEAEMAWIRAPVEAILRSHNYSNVRPALRSHFQERAKIDALILRNIFERQERAEGRALLRNMDASPLLTGLQEAYVEEEVEEEMLSYEGAASMAAQEAARRRAIRGREAFSRAMEILVTGRVKFTAEQEAVEEAREDTKMEASQKEEVTTVEAETEKEADPFESFSRFSSKEKSKRGKCVVS
jgi:hypothetical protein